MYVRVCVFVIVVWLMCGMFCMDVYVYLYIYIHSHQKFDFRTKLYELREERPIKPSVFSNLVSTMLYEKRYVT